VEAGLLEWFRRKIHHTDQSIHEKAQARVIPTIEAGAQGVRALDALCGEVYYLKSLMQV
jgi:hypothetical protein